MLFFDKSENNSTGTLHAGHGKLKARREPNAAKFQQFIYVDGKSASDERLLTVNKAFVEGMGYDMAFFDKERSKGFESLHALFKEDIAQDSTGGFFIVPVKDRATFEADLEAEIEKDIEAEVKKFSASHKAAPDHPKNRKGVLRGVLACFTKG